MSLDTDAEQQLAIRTARGMNRIEIDPPLFEHRQQCTQRAWSIERQEHADEAWFVKIGEKVAESFEGIATLGDRFFSDIRAAMR
jgi:hypothetical protein